MASTLLNPVKVVFFSLLRLIAINISDSQQNQTAYMQDFEKGPNTTVSPIIDIKDDSQQNQTTLVFYLQDVGKGPNTTVSPVIGIKDKVWSYNTFGTIFVVDDPVTFSPSATSIQIGRVQGVITVASQDGANMNIIMSIVFNNEEYSGSTLEIQGTSRQHEDLRELSVVSGTGKFRFAKGFIVFETISYDAFNNQSVIRLTITLKIP